LRHRNSVVSVIPCFFAHLGDRHALALRLAHDRDDLLFGEPALAHAGSYVDRGILP
jgi:hypothetical protein